MRSLISRAAVAAGAAAVLMGPAVGVASAHNAPTMLKFSAVTVHGAARWTIQPIPAPPGGMNSGVGAVSCPSASACTAVGAYNPSAGGAATLAERWNGKHWSMQTTPAVNPWDFFNAVSCPSTTACVAVGYRYPKGVGGITLPLAERWNGTKWANEPAPNPTGANGTQLTGVSCTSPAACTAVGYATNAKPVRVTLAERWNGKKWSIQTTPNPRGSRNSLFLGVSCPSATACTAVGFGPGVLAEHWNGTKWSIQSAPNPKGTTFSEAVNVSCASVSACTAIGIYNKPSGTLMLAERWNGTKWSTQTPPTTPPGASSSSLGGLSCATATICTVTGSYMTGPRTQLTLAERWNGTKWSIQATPNPRGATNSGLGGVSCTTPNVCTAVGDANHSPGMFAERYS